MYLSRLHLKNWRSYADATFDFNEPTERKSVVLIGAMNGHGKTSFLVSLYLGLFGKFGLRHCEGFTGNDSNGNDSTYYRKAIADYRRSSADPDWPTEIDVTLTPTIRDIDEEEVRIVRRWYFTGRNEPKPGSAFEEVDIYVGGRLQRPVNQDKDPLILAHERVERNLFQAHAPSFFLRWRAGPEAHRKYGRQRNQKSCRSDVWNQNRRRSCQGDERLPQPHSFSGGR